VLTSAHARAVDILITGWPTMSLGRVVVEGDSMMPTLRAGDRCIVKWGQTAQVGDIVVARRPDRPELIVVKRVSAIEPDGHWLEGDNTKGSHDSWVFGPVASAGILAVVTYRYWPSPRRLFKP